MTFISDLFTKHLLAKFIALIFAVTTVFLVHRELLETWVTNTEPVPVVSARDRGTMIETGEPFVSMTRDEGVWISRPPSSIRMDIVGTARERDVFRGEPIIQLRVRDEWLGPKGQRRDHILEANDFRLRDDLSSATIVVQENQVIGVEAFARRAEFLISVTPPTQFEAGRTYAAEKNLYSPATVTLEGPQSVLDRFSTASRDTGLVAAFDLPPSRGTPYRSGVSYSLSLAKKWEKAGVRLVGENVSVTLGASAGEEVSVTFDGFVVSWLLRESDRNLLAVGELVLQPDVTMECRLVVKGPKALLAPFIGPEKRKVLSRRLQALVDPGSDIDALLPGGAERGPNLPILIAGLPAGLTAELPGVKTVTCRMRRLEKSD